MCFTYPLRDQKQVGSCGCVCLIFGSGTPFWWLQKRTKRNKTPFWWVPSKRHTHMPNVSRFPNLRHVRITPRVRIPDPGGTEICSRSPARVEMSSSVPNPWTCYDPRLGNVIFHRRLNSRTVERSNPMPRLSGVGACHVPHHDCGPEILPALDPGGSEQINAAGGGVVPWMDEIRFAPKKAWNVASPTYLPPNSNFHVVQNVFFHPQQGPKRMKGPPKMGRDQCSV